MAYLEFALTDKKFFKAKEQWAKDGKTPEEISMLTTEMLHKCASEREAAGASAAMTKFPPWLRDFLRTQIATAYNGAKLKWDPENDVLSAHVLCDVLELNDWLGGDFTKALTELVADKAEFNDNFQLHATPRDTDGQREMADLENHYRSAAKESAKGKKKEEEVAVEDHGEDEEDGDEE